MSEAEGEISPQQYVEMVQKMEVQVLVRDSLPSTDDVARGTPAVLSIHGMMDTTAFVTDVEHNADGGLVMVQVRSEAADDYDGVFTFRRNPATARALPTRPRNEQKGPGSGIIWNEVWPGEHGFVLLDIGHHYRNAPQGLELPHLTSKRLKGTDIFYVKTDAARVMQRLTSSIEAGVSGDDVPNEEG